MLDYPESCKGSQVLIRFQFLWRGVAAPHSRATSGVSPSLVSERPIRELRVSEGVRRALSQLGVMGGVQS